MAPTGVMTLTRTVASTPAPSRTPVPAFPVEAGTPLPTANAPIGPATAGTVRELARWTGPHNPQAVWSADGRLLFITTSLDLRIYPTGDFSETVWGGCAFLDSAAPGGGPGLAAAVQCQDGIHLVRDFSAPPSGKPLLPYQPGLTAFALAPDLQAAVFATASQGAPGTATLEGYDLARRAPLWSVTVQDAFFSRARLQFLPGGQELLVRYQEHSDVVRLVDGKVLSSLQVNPAAPYLGQVGRLALPFDGKKFALWDPLTGRSEEFPYSRPVASYTIDPLGQSAAVVDGEKHLLLVELSQSPAVRWSIRLDEKDPLIALVFTPDGARLLVFKNSGVTSVLDPASGRELLSYAHENFTEELSFSPNGQYAAARRASTDSTVRIWDPRDGSRAVNKAFAEKIRDFAFPPDPNQLVTFSENGVQVRQRETGQVTGSCFAITNSLNFALFPDGRSALWEVYDWAARSSWIASVSMDTCQEATRYGLSGSIEPSRLALAPDGSFIAQAAPHADPSFLRVWSRTGDVSVMLPLNPAFPATLRFSPDSRLLAAAFNERLQGRIELRRREGTLLTTLSLPAGFSSGTLEFSPDSTWLAVSSQEQLLILNLKTSERRGPFAFPGEIGGLAYAPGGGLLAVASQKAILLVDPVSGKVLARLEGHSGSISALHFSPDGNYLVSTSEEDGTLRWWGES